MAFPERIVCLAAEIPDILSQLGALDSVVGISAYTTRPVEALRIPKVSGFQHGRIDRILRDAPDIVILTSGVQKELAEQLAASGATLLHLNPHRFDDVYDTIRLLGNLVQRTDEARQLVEHMKQQVNQIQEQGSQLPFRPRVYFEEWMDPLICGTGWVSDMIEIAGGIDVFREKSVRGRGAFERVVSHEDVIEANPDVVLASWCGKPFNYEAFISRSDYNHITAVQRGHVFEVDSEILQCGTMLVDQLRRLSNVFHEIAKMRV